MSAERLHSPLTAAKHSVCPVCEAELLPGRALVAPFHRRVRACRFACRECLAIVRVREQLHAHVTDVEIPGPVVVRRLHGIREAREAGRLDEELALLRESRVHRLLLRVPEVFAEARHAFRGRVRLAAAVQFPHREERPVLERCEGPLIAMGLEERWTRTPYRSADALAMPAGWELPLAGVQGTYLALKPHAAAGNEEPRPLPSGIAGFFAPLDVLAPSDGVW